MKDDTFKVVLGDHGAEVAAIQLIALTHSNAAEWVQKYTGAPVSQFVPAIYLRSAHYLTLVSLGAPETPLEVVALAARSVFELFVRLKYVLMSDQYALQWRSEAAKDQIEIYDAILTLSGDEAAMSQISSEINRVKFHSNDRGLDQSMKIMNAVEVSKKVGLQDEHKAFYKLYSKLVHPSSFSVNWPDAVSSPMYRDSMIVNTQVYANLMLEEMRSNAKMPVGELKSQASALMHGKLRNH
jgi:hypothetical protein